MPVLPIIDLLIFLGWTTLASGGVLKAIYLATSYRPRLAGLAPGDLMMVACCFLLMALALSARSLVRRGELDLARREARARQGEAPPRERDEASLNSAAHAREARRS